MSDAVITWISGPVLHAKCLREFRTNESVFIGEKRLLGEVISINGDLVVIQVYEDTTGLKPGDPVHGSDQLMCAQLGPHLLGKIFDGLLRPLDGQRAFIGHGQFTPLTQPYPFAPIVDINDELQSGQSFGEVRGQNIVQQCLVPPDLQGTVDSIAVAGNYDVRETVLRLRLSDGSIVPLSMSHDWPVRRPRPVRKRLAGDQPLISGQRVLDSLFPLSKGGKAAMPGGFGTGKTVLQESLAKWCDADVIIYVGCGERGNEMAGVLHDLPQLTDPRTGRPLLERTVIIANTSNMPVAAREASIYTAVTVGEYFRDQGLHVALMADSTSRWAEALREISGRLGELPGEGGYPAYLSSRLAEFYERAARVRTLAGREGSLTIIGAVSPPSGDFSEPVTAHTKRYTRCFWALDPQRAQARFFPAVNPLHSYSEEVQQLAAWWHKNGHHHWVENRRRLLVLLEQQARLERMARIIGKEALPPKQQLTLLCADLINTGFLNQSAFSKTDASCSPARQALMLECLILFFDQAEMALEYGQSVEHIAELPVVRKLNRMAESIDDSQLNLFDDLIKEINQAFAIIEHKHES